MAIIDMRIPAMAVEVSSRDYCVIVVIGGSSIRGKRRGLGVILIPTYKWVEES